MSKKEEPIEAAKYGVARLKGFENWEQLERGTNHDMKHHWEDVARVLNLLLKQIQEVLKDTEYDQAKKETGKE